MANRPIYSPPRPEPGGRGIAYWAFWLNRLSGVVLAVYLFFHLGFLFNLNRGPEAYQRFLDVVSRPVFLWLDVGLAAALIFHGLNGIRLTIVGLGRAVRYQGQMLAGVFVLGLMALAAMAVRMLKGG